VSLVGSGAALMTGAGEVEAGVKETVEGVWG
jgi:hypothetical protein